MGCFVVHHHHPGFLLLCRIFNDVQGKLCDLISDMGVVVEHMISILDELRLVVLALAYQDIPVVESGLRL